MNISLCFDHPISGQASLETVEAPKVSIRWQLFFVFFFFLEFLILRNGLQVDGMRKPCPGSMDKNPPKEILWKTFSRRLFFGRESTRTWGPGGVAFLNPETSVDEKTYICMYRITYVVSCDCLHFLTKRDII